ncbi:MAG TPA: hypothetical protein ENN90_03740 [Mariniphaga anaerophila]|uniref:Uncharacterized protein n=1 Tax=Mariniphaga anaerophila TaxID=1484053 RepID=A0A831PJP0_9BACT|nr:hypothetical protein [Mariniphaga anaerophila]
MSGISLALKIGSLVLGLGAYMVLFKKVKGLKKYGVTSLIYVLLVSLLLSATTLFLYLRPGTSEFAALIFAQLVIISLGTLHVLFASELLPWYSDQVFSMQLVFIICMLLFSYFFANMAFTFLVESNVEMVWHLSSLWFLVPVLLNQTIEKLLEVPPKQFKKWHYPVGVSVEDPTNEEMENPVVISFVFKKNAESEDATTFRAKAPQEMKLGMLFYFFINDYNSRHPESPVAFADKNNQPHPWIFFKLKSKWLKIKTALDPEDTILNCRIKENDVLVCNRELINEKISDHETTE